MPRNTDRPLSAEEQKFIRHYVRERNIEIAERKARLKVGQGIQFYKRAHVREDIDRRLAVIELEQAKVDAKDIDRRQESIEDLLGPELCRVIKLDPEKYGATKLKGLQLGFVVAGRIQQGNTIALDRSQSPGGSGVSIYESVFERRHEDDAKRDAPATTPAPPNKPKQEPAATPSPTPPTPPRPPSGKTVIRVY